MRPLVIHASSKATSERPRRVLRKDWRWRSPRDQSRFLAALGMTCLIMVRECRFSGVEAPGKARWVMSELKLRPPKEIAGLAG
jgi:hypothetical protein